MIKNFLIFLIELYQKLISPLFPPRCKYYPSCSEYAKISLTKNPLFFALKQSIVRIFRCNPFSLGGVDFPSTSSHFLKTSTFSPLLQNPEIPKVSYETPATSK